MSRRKTVEFEIPVTGTVTDDQFFEVVTAVTNEFGETTDIAHEADDQPIKVGVEVPIWSDNSAAISFIKTLVLRILGRG